MKIEYVILLSLAFLVFGFLYANWRNHVAGENAEMKTYANWHEPIFVEQTFFGAWWQERAVEEYDMIRAKLKEHGNQFLDPLKDVHLFIHRLDVDHPILDFADWRLQIRKEQAQILENFFIPLANRAAQSGDKAMAARLLQKAGRNVEFVKENGEY